MSITLQALPSFWLPNAFWWILFLFSAVFSSLVNALIDSRQLASLLSALGRVKRQRKGGSRKTRREGNPTLGTLISDFPASRIMSNTFLLFQPPGLWCSIIAAQTHKDTHLNVNFRLKNENKIHCSKVNYKITPFL